MQYTVFIRGNKKFFLNKKIYIFANFLIFKKKNNNKITRTMNTPDLFIHYYNAHIRNLVLVEQVVTNNIFFNTKNKPTKIKLNFGHP